jgi:hypothetical protein
MHAGTSFAGVTIKRTDIPAKAGQKSPGAIFEQPKAGPEGAEYRYVFRNPEF